MRFSRLNVAATSVFRMMAICVPVAMLLGVALANDEPSSGKQQFAQNNPKAGFLKQGVIKGGAKKDTWWFDTDGVDPGTPGCHIEVQGENDKTPTGRTIGEYCESGTILVETNPAANVLHKHTNDIGHPDRVDCSAWCKGSQGRKAGGVCKAAAAPPCKSSARCECN